MEKLISLLFLARDLAHREHLRTDSFSAHMALGSFYDEIIDRADAIAEAYQGSYKRLENFPITGSNGDMEILKLLQEHVKWIDKNRYECCDESDTAIQNLIDEAVATYLSTIYKLRFLK